MAATREQQNSLGLAGDGDELDLLQECEALFGVTFSDADSRELRTAGNLFDLLDREKGFTARRATACYSLRGFHRLRARLVEMGVKRRVTPKTPLRLILDDLGTDFRRFRRALKHDLGDFVPHGAFADDRQWLVLLLRAFALVAWLPVVLVVDLLFAGPDWLSGPLLVGSAILTAAGFGYGLPGLLRTEPPACCRTVGDLAHIYGAKCLDDDPGAIETVAARDAWDRFVVLMRAQTGYGGPVTRETALIGDAGGPPALR